MKLNSKIIIAVLSILALGVRFYLIVKSEPLADEIWMSSLANNNYKDIWLGALTDSNGPFYYLYIHFMSNLFGFNSNIVFYRLNSLLFWILGGFGLLALASTLSGKKFAIITYLVYLFLPSSVWVAVYERYYSLLIVLTGLFLIVYIRIIRKRKTRDFIFLTFISVIGIYTHFYFYLLVLTICIYLIFSKQYHRLLNKWLFVLSSIILFTSPAVLYFLILPKYGVVNLSNSFLKIPAVLISYISSYQAIIYIYQYRLNIFFSSIFILIFIILLFLLIQGCRKWNNKYKVLFLLIVLLPPLIALIVSYSIRPSFAVNSLLIFLPVLIIIFSKGIEYYLVKNKTIVVIFILTIILSYIPFLESFRLGSIFAKPFLYVKTNFRKSDLVLHNDLYTFIGAKYYLENSSEYGIVSTTTTSLTERVHGYSKLSLDRIDHYVGRIWYFEPNYYNISTARKAKNYLDNNLILIRYKRFVDSGINVYLYCSRLLCANPKVIRSFSN